MSLFRKKQKTIKEKIKKGNFDDFDMDFDSFDKLDLGIDDLDSQVTSNKRTPIRSIGKGVLKGVKSHLLDFNRHKREILKGFPDLVSETIDTIKETSDSIADQIRDTARSSKSDFRDIAQGIDRSMPSKYKKLKSSTERLAQRLRDNVTENDVSAERSKEDSISKTLEEIFSASQSGDNYRQSRSEAQQAISEKLSNERHKQTTFQLGKIQEGIAIGNAFSAKVNTAFQKKLLELQFRSYYVQADTLLTLKEYSGTTKALLAGILKNTALPDYIKTTESDRLKMTARREIYGLAKDKLFSKSRYLKNISSEVNSRIKNIDFSTITEGLQNLEMMNDANTDYTEYAAQLITDQLILPGITGKLIKKAMNKYVSKDSEKYRKVVELAAAMQNPERTGNKAADILEEMQYDPNFAKSSLGKLLSPMVDILRSASSKNPTKVKLNNDEELLTATSFNKLTQLSIVKVIPGYLARILQQSERIANSKTSGKLPEMTEFNPYTGEFIKSSKMTKALASKFNKETESATSARSYYEVGQSLVETKEGSTIKNETYLSIKANSKILTKQLTDAGKALNQLYIINKENINYNKTNKNSTRPVIFELDSSKGKSEIAKEITNIKNELDKFKKEYFDNNTSIYSFPYSDYYSIEGDAYYLINRINGFSKTLQQEISVKSSFTGTETSFSSIYDKVQSNHDKLKEKIDSITKYNSNYESTDSSLMARFVAAANSQGIIVKEYPEYIKNGSFKTTLEITYGFSKKEINRIKEILTKSEVYKNPDALATAVSMATSAYETQHTGTSFAENVGSVFVESNKHLKNQGYKYDTSDNTVQNTKDSFVRRLGKNIQNIAKENDLRFWQNQLLVNIPSKDTRDRFNTILKELDPSARQKLLQYVHDNGSPTEIENMINQIIIKYKNYRGDNTKDIFFEKLSSEEELPSYESAFSSDINLKYLHGKYSLKHDTGYKRPKLGMADAISELKSDHKWSYKNDPKHTMHMGPMAQDVQAKFGDTVAPGGKKIDIPSMFGVVNIAIKEINDELKSYKDSTAIAIKNLIGTSSAFYTADLSIRGLKGKSIKDIFEKSASVENITSVVGKAKKYTEDIYDRTKTELEKRFHIAKDKKEAIKGYIAAARQKKPLSTAAGKINDTIQNLSRNIATNEDLKGTFLDRAASRIAKDTDAIINANSSEQRTDALSDMLVTLIAGGVEKIGEGGRFAHKHTTAKIVGRVIDYTKSIKGIGCMSNVYLGKQNLQNPVLFSRNYTTTDISEMYFDAKTGKRISSACHIKGAVAKNNGDLIFTNEEIKEHGLYILDANGHPIKLGGLKFMAALGVNTALRVGKYLGKKILKNPVVTKVGRLVKRVTNPITSRLGMTGQKGWLHATIATLKGDNQLLPYLTNKLNNARNNNIPIIGKHLAKYSAIAKDAIYGNIHDDDEYYNPDNIENRQHESDVLKAMRHHENVNSKLTEEENNLRYNKGIEKISRMKVNKNEKKRLLNLLHVRHYGVEHPDLKGAKITKTHKRLFNGGIRKTINRGIIKGAKYTLGAAIGLPLLPIAAPLAAMYGAHKLKKGLPNVKDKITSLFTGNHPVKDNNEEEVSDVAKSLEKANKKEEHNDKKFYDTKVNGQEVRRGGIKYMLAKMKDKGKKSTTKVIDMIKNHKKSSGLGILGLLGLIAGGIDKLIGLFGFGFTDIAAALRLGKFLGKGALDGAKSLFNKFKGAGTDVAEDGAEGAAAAEGTAGVGMLATGAAAIGAGAAGYAAGKYIVNPALNYGIKKLTGGKDRSLGQLVYHGVSNLGRALTGTHSQSYYVKLRNNKNVPLGIRINNPGYIKDWPPTPHLSKVKGYVKFINSADGIVALGMSIKYYISKGFNTIPKLVTKLDLPSTSESNSKVITDIVISSRISGNSVLNPNDPEVMDKLLSGIITALNGRMYYAPQSISTYARVVATGGIPNILNVSSGKKIVSGLSGHGKGHKNVDTAKNLKNKKTSNSFWTNLFNFGGNKNTNNGAAATVRYVKQANNFGIPGTNPQGMKGFTPPNPQKQLVKAKNLSLSQKQVKQKIESVSRAHGFDTQYLLVVAAHESGLQPNAQNPEGSAAGLYQYISQTWLGKISQYASAYNLPLNSSPFDIKASTIVAGASVDTDTAMMSKIKSPVTYLDTYLIHFLGSGAGPQFLRAMLQKPTITSSSMFPEQAQWNPEFFYDGGRALSLKGTYEAIGNSFDYAAKSFGLKGRSTDIIGSHGGTKTLKPKTSPKLKKAVTNIAKQSKGIKKAQTLATGATIGGIPLSTAKKYLNTGKKNKVVPISTIGLPNISQANGYIPTTKEVAKETAVAKKHVSTPTVVNLGDEHKRLISKSRVTTASDNGTVQTNHLSNISSSNAEIKTILHQQLLIQTKSLEYLKHITIHLAKTSNKPVVSNSRPNEPTHAVKPIEPVQAVHVGKTVHSLL